jgi:hypothetical protein
VKGRGGEGRGGEGEVVFKRGLNNFLHISLSPSTKCGSIRHISDAL